MIFQTKITSYVERFEAGAASRYSLGSATLKRKSFLFNSIVLVPFSVLLITFLTTGTTAWLLSLLSPFCFLSEATSLLPRHTQGADSRVCLGRIRIGT
jgi:hypothetical protein